MTEFWLIRHGQTDWNLQGRYQGHADIPLNQTGLEQAQKLADSLNGERFDAIYSSDLQRARATAERLAARLRLPIHLDKRLREIDQGEWAGRLISEVVASFQGGYDPIQVRPPGGETVAEVASRLAAAADDIALRHPNQRVMIVSHGLAVATLICQAGQIEMQAVYDHIPANATPKIIQWK